MERLERHIAALRERGSELPDKRTGRNGPCRMADIALAAFSVFFMQSPSFLAHQRAMAAARGRSNAHTLFAMTRIPCDNHIRQMQGGAPPEHLDPLFAAIVGDLEASGDLDPLRCLAARVLIAQGGSEHFRSRKIHCRHCSTRRRADGEVEYFHAFLGASLVAPGHATVLPLPAGFLRPRDGAAKQDSEVEAARRWLARLGPTYAGLEPVHLGDDLFAHQPMVEAIRAQGASFILVCKPSSHKTLAAYLQGVLLDGYSESRGRGAARRIHRYRCQNWRWMSEVPLRDGDDALAVNWLEVEITRPDGKLTYRSCFVTDLPVDRLTVALLAACGRARWKIENETFNVLKTSGYHLEHNFGHGKETLASLLVALNLFAFALQGACDLAEATWRQARARLGARKRLLEHLRALTAHHLFPSRAALLHTILTGTPPRGPP